MEFEDEYAAFSSTNTQDRIPCGICGRNFAPEVLDRHTPICQKSAMKKRKVFDSVKMRAEGTEISTVKKPGGPGRRGPQKATAIPAKKSNWRQQHEEFIRSIRGAKQAQDAVAQGKPLPPPPPPSINPDYVQCDYCGRRFNETAAERHIPFCREKNQRLGKMPTKPGHSVAAEKQAKRLQYQAPRLKSKGSPGGSASTPTRNTNHSNSRLAGAQRSTPGTKTSAYRRSDPASPSNEYSPGMGSALRTGRTNDTYDDARQFSAKQRSGIPRNKFPSNDSISKYANRPPSGTNSESGDSYGMGRAGRAGSATTARFCHECGTKYPVPSAKFCCECGIKRITIR